MERDILRTLLGMRDATIDELRSRDERAAALVTKEVEEGMLARLMAVAKRFPEAVRERILKLASEKPSGALTMSLRAELAGLGLGELEIRAILDRTRRAERDRALPPDEPIIGKPEVERLVERARLVEVSELAGLRGNAAAAVAEAVASPTNLDDATLAKLVEERKLSAEDAKRVGVAVAVYELADGKVPLAAAVRDAKPASLGGASPRSTEDLAKVSAEEWAHVLAATPDALPEGVSAESAGAGLARRFAVLHPSIAFVSRLPKAEPTRVVAAARELTRLLEKNERVVGEELASLDTTGLGTEHVATLAATHAELRRLDRAYPGMKVAEVLDDRQRAPEDKASTVARRVALVETARANAGDRELFQLDLTDGSEDVKALKLESTGASPEERGMVVGTLKSYQRAWALTGNADDARLLVERGARWSGDVAAGKVAVDKKHIRDKARTSLADVTMTAGSILDLFHGLFDDLGVGNGSPSAKEYLKKLAGFQDLFGNLSFCACEHCQSILGPAAYFVDLMKYVDENLRSQLDGTTDHPLDLRTRRPDLWTLELTCANTNERIPTLELVNEILENFAARKLGHTGSLTDRAAIGALVYRDTLATRVDSLRQPFHLPLARIRAYLNVLARGRGDVARALGATGPVLARAELGMSLLDWQRITTAETGLAALKKLFGIDFAVTGSTVDPVHAHVLATSLGVDRATLAQIVATRLVESAAGTITIVSEKSSPQSVQNDVELVKGLTTDALDRIHRLTRLARRLPWTVVETDLVLTALGATALTSAAVEDVARLHAAQAALVVGDVEELAALVGAIPAALFDRLFNAPTLVAADGNYPKATTHFIHPAFRASTAAPADPNITRLLAGLGVDLDGLATLARELAPALAQETASGFDPEAASDADRHFVLSAENLALLYRHARLARLLGVDLVALFQLIRLAGLARVASAADLAALLDVHEWWRTTTFSVDDVVVATGGAPRDPTRFPDPPAVAAAIVTSAATALTFKSTIFAVAPGTTEQGSLDLIQANPGIIEAATEPDTWRIVAGVDLDTAPITIPPTATVPTPPTGTRAVTDAEVRDALRPYLAKNVALRGLGTAFGVLPDKAEALAVLAGQVVSSNGIAVALRGGAIAPLEALVAAIVPVSVAFRGATWDAAAVDWVRLNAARFSTDAIPRPADSDHPAPYLSLAQLRAAGVYASLIERRRASSGSLTAAEIVAELQGALAAFDASVPEFPAGSEAAVAAVLEAPAGVIVGLRGRVAIGNVAVPALGALDRAAAMAVELGVDGTSFAGLVSDDYAILSATADALVAAIRARFTDEATRAAKLAEAEEPIREAKRDALVDHHLRSLTPALFTSQEDLYRYFLIDVAAGGCSTTSRVVAATSSVQLYVHRVIMNLEQDDLPPTNSQHRALRMPAEALAEWGWRKNYRVWEANRKVFLWPENYIEPDLRDDKTPLFKELEGELLQTEVSDLNVLDAYSKYLKGFEDVATLTIAGAYHDVRNDGETSRDVLHLFGVTAGDPPTYHYRTCENLIASGKDPNTAAIWSPWVKVPVQITGRKVAPVVHRGRLHLFWVDIRTRPLNEVHDGKSEFTAYSHKMAMKFTTLRPDASWTPPQEVTIPSSYYFSPSGGEVRDTLYSDVPDLDTRNRTHVEPIDDYTLSGPNWDWVWVDPSEDKLKVRLRNFVAAHEVDLFKRQLKSTGYDGKNSPHPQVLCAKVGGATKALYFGQPSFWWWSRSAWANAVIDEARLDVLDNDIPLLKALLGYGLYAEHIATIPATTELLAVPGNVEDGLLQVGNDLLLLQGSVTDDADYLLRRLGTTLVEEVARKLFEDGVDVLLSTETQLALAEAGLPITLVGSRIEDRTNKGTLDFKGPYGVYYRELFFHIPFLIANALNAQGRYAAAQRWYHFIFDPTATEVIAIPDGTPAEEIPHRLLDRVWRYREFRGLDLERLRDILTDEVAIALYKKDPFNPHAIARRRISAYQKTIVMKYVDNLIDWADFLFTQFTMESVNEALMLYIMAQDVLGPRPVEIGDCGEGTVTPKTYERIAPLVDRTSEVLVELESWVIGARVKQKRPKAARKKGTYALERPAVMHAAASASLKRLAGEAAGGPDHVTVVDKTAQPQKSGMFTGSWGEVRTGAWAPEKSTGAVRTVDKQGGRVFEHKQKGTIDVIGKFGWSIIRQVTPVFCVPPNKDLLAYWDRVEDRLFKIRHCMDITGQRRELSLFAPEIDPRLLVRARAAGLSLDDVLGATGGNLPPYRFLFLVDRAKAFASGLSGYGAALLSALEKKDGEELNRLRLVHQKNLSSLQRKLRQLEIDSSAETLEGLQRQRTAAVYRRDFFEALATENRNGWEIAESATRHAASAIHVTESIIDTVSAITALIPQLGSPFAMKYGGVEIGTSLQRFGNAIHAIANGLEAIASSTSLEGNMARRVEGWRHQKQLADHDVDVLDKQIRGAEIRLDMANRSLALHDKSAEQIDELLELADGKFSSLGLYTYLSTQLQRLYRSAYNNALSLAKLAEQAFRFERPGDTSVALEPSYWDPSHAGFLSGERLLIDLQRLERRFLETNYRTLEIDQAFALSQVDPRALVSLRATGECVVEIPEVYFDLYYPGHYRRRIKAVRLTIPSITGPYVNVSATLALENSWIRPTPSIGAPLVEVPPSRSVAIATSSAQNDAGVFELSFRDERYMPFEGLGAVSRWRLTLPRSFRQFDYETINDVILSISYTAEQDGALRDRVETLNANLAGGILKYFKDNSARRVFSLRQDFSSAFTRLVRSPASTPVRIELNDRHFPLLFKGRAIAVQRGLLVLRTADGGVPAGFAMTVDGAAVNAFATEPALGDLPARDLPGAFTANPRAQHTLTITAAGGLAPTSPPPGDVSVVDEDKLLDILLFIEYRLA